jgi:glutathione S-transferase
MIMPKPDVVALTGGYRKTPVLQVGADIYCDTALICDVLEHVQPEPTLYPEPSKGLARIFAQWADNTLFWAAMAYNTAAQGRGADVRQAPPEAAKAFGEDRKAMSVGMTRLRPATPPPPTSPTCAASPTCWTTRLPARRGALHRRLRGLPPAVVHAHRTPVLAGILKLTPAVLDWMDRMAAIGHGTFGSSRSADAADAIAVAPLRAAAALGHD